MSSYRSYVPWNKSGLSSSYSAGSKSTDTGSTSSSQYDGGGRRYSSGGGTSSYLGSSYRSTPSYLSSSYSSGSSYLKDKDSGGGSSYLNSSAKEKDTAGRVPKEAVGSGSSYLSSSVKDKTSSGTLNKESRDTSSDRLAQLRDKYQKKDTSPEPPTDRYGSNSLSPYCRHYGRSSSYTRSSSRNDSEPSTSTPSSPSHAPTSLRFGTASRYGSSIIRSPVSEKPPPVFGLSGLGYSRSLSRSTSSQQDTDKSPSTTAPESPSTPVPDEAEIATTEVDQKKEATKDGDASEEPPRQTTFITVVTRGTSPTPPSTSPYLRSRRAELARVLEKTIAKPATRPETCDKEIQSDRGDDTARLSRYGRWSAASTSSYLDRYPAASRYSRYGSTYSSRLSEDSERKSDTPKSSYSPTSSASTLSVDKSGSLSSVDKSKTESVGEKNDNRQTVNSVDGVESKGTGTVKKVESKNIVTGVRDNLEKKITGVNTVNSKLNTAVTTASTNSAKTADNQAKSVANESVNKTDSGDGKNTSNKLLIPRSPSSAKVEEAQKVPAFQKKSVVKEPQLAGNKDGAAEAEAAKSDESKSSESETKVLSKLPPKSLSSSSSSSDSASKTSQSIAKKEDTTSNGETSKAVGLTKTKSVKNLTSKPDLSLDISTKKSKSENGSSSPSATSKSPSEKMSPTVTGISAPVDTKKDSTVNADASKKLGLTRASSMKNLSLKPPLQPDAAKQKASSSGDESASPKQNNFKSAPVSPTDAASRKTADLSKGNETSATTKSNEDTNSKPNSKLPPPVPKSDLRPSASAHSIGSKMTNKDFRKSALNMEISNALQAEALKKQRTLASRSASSASSGGESDTALHPSKSSSKLPSPSAQQDAITAELKNRSRKASSSSSSSSSTSSSSSSSSCTSSSSESESSDEEDDKNMSVPVIRRRRRGSPLTDSMHASADESLSVEKPPLAPAQKSPEQPRSLLVRAVTSLFRFGRGDATSSSENLSESVEKSKEDGSTEGVSEQQKDTACNGETKGRKKRVENDAKPPLGIQKDKSSSSIKDGNAPEKNKKKVYKIRHHESGELPWWQADNADVPEGIQRIYSNSSLNTMKDSDKLSRDSSNSTINKMQDTSKSELTTSEEKGDKVKKKLYKIKHQPSGELPWWLDNSKPIPEGVQRILSNSSIDKLQDADGQSEILNKLSKVLSNASVNKTNSGEENNNSEETEKKQKRKIYKIRHVESGEIPWWLDNNAPIPEGVQRIHSNSSINKISQESGVEGKRSNNVSRTPSNAAVNRTKTSSDEEHKISEDGERKEKKKLHKIRHQPSGELPWWLDSNAPIPEGIQRIQSNSSVNKLHQDSDAENRKSDAVAKGQESEGVAVQRAASKSSISSDKPPSGKRKVKPIQHKSSGELSVPDGMKHIGSGSDNKDSDADNKQGVTRVKSSHSVQQTFPYKIRHQESGEKAWWLSSHGDIPAGVQKLETSSSESSDEEAEQTAQVPKFPLQIPDSRVSVTAETTDNSGRRSPYDNLPTPKSKTRPKNLPLFIGTHTNIDEILGTAASTVEPVMGVSRLRGKKQPSSGEEDGSECEEVDAAQVRIHDSTPQTPSIQRVGNEARRRSTSGMIKLDDTALQLYKDGDYGAYLDLEASISEQHEELDGFHTNRKNSIVLRTQLSVRVHTIIEKLLNSEGRELRRALFSLKQIFQEDKDLVHEFVQNDGLACLIKVGSEADQNYQNYILRALGQVMLYVDGMNGVMEHNQTVQWLYALIASKFRLVVKTALKLLLVFVEYVETNCLLLIKAVHAVDTSHGLLPWSNIMKLLKDYDAADTELLIYAMTLVNKTLNGIPDQDTYYDQVDSLEEQGMEGTIQRYMSKQGTDLDLLRQFQIYEAVLHHEDGEEKGTPLKQLDENVRKTLRHRKSLGADTAERRKSRRHSTGTSPATVNRLQVPAPTTNATPVADDDEAESSSSRSSPGPEINGSYKERDSKAGDAGVTPALRRRRERAERQRSFIREQQECAAATLRASRDGGSPDENVRLCKRLGNGTTDNKSRSKDLTPLLNAVNKMQDAPETNGEGGSILKKPWVLSMMYGKNNSMDDAGEEPVENGNDAEETTERGKLKQLKRENTVKDLTQKLSNQNVLHSPVESVNRIGDMTGLISKAKEELAKSQTKIVRSPTSENLMAKVEVKKSETELHWEELVHSMKRPLTLCDLDFTDLRSDDEVDILSPAHVSNGGPPPPPPVPMSPTRSIAPPPPPPATRLGGVAPPPMPPAASTALRRDNTKSPPPPTIKKTKKTVKLFWKEVRDDPIILAKLQRSGMIWDELHPIAVDTQKLEHLFESRAKDLITKKQQEMNKNKEVIVLDHKRSNAINIGMTKLPPPRSIKTAILKMDATIMNREGIEKLLTMLPTEEERSKIQEAQMANPDLPLGSAEQFLLTLASISELPARLKLWAFKLDFENSEKEIAEPLMDLKQGMETLKNNKTFRGILSTLLSIGIFLNGSEVKGFQIEYLAKVPEVKDTVHKHSLLHHLCHMVMEKFPDSSDLYSEIGAITRASKVDFDELAANIVKLETECKASWDHLKLIAKHDGSSMKVKMSDFLADCAERIIVLGIVHRRVMNRFHKFLLWLGIPLHRVADTKPNEFCRIVSEFALEYRTTRERVLQQLEKKANHRERNKTRGKMITEVGKFRTKEDRADAELRQLLGGDLSDVEGTLPWRRQRKDLGRNSLGPMHREEVVNGNLTDGDDEILESLVKTATKAPSTRTTPRERKRTRHADRKSLKRSRTRENNPEGGRESP